MSKDQPQRENGAGKAAPSKAAPKAEPKPEPSLLAAVDRTLTKVIEHPSVPRQFVHIVQMIVLGMRRVQIPRMAAALSYRTIFGLIPVLVVAIVFFAAFSSQESVAEQIRKILNFAGLDRIELTSADPSTSPTPQGGLNPELTNPAPESPALNGPPAPEQTRLDAWIGEAVQRVRTLPPGTLSVIAILTLVYAAISMMVDIEKSFNQIYMAPGGRSWPRRVMQYWALLTLGSLGLISTFAIQEWANSKLDDINNIEFVGGAIYVVARFTVPLLISSLLFFTAYATVPNTRVQFFPALVGALLAALIWEGGKYGITTYLRNAKGFSSLYGPLALVPLFLLWVYVTWIIVLSGLQVAHALQTYSTAKAAGLTRSVLETLGLVTQAAESRRTLIVDPASTLVVMCDVAGRFRSGKPSGSSIVADKTGIDERVVSEMLERLWRAGLLHRVSGGDDDGAYTLAGPPDTLRARDALVVGEELVAVDRERAPKLLGELSAARLSVMEGRTLADLLPPAPPAPEPSTRAHPATA
ncbi:MAG: YihY family inner membrane protein [Phycisphaerae bacterium]|nr:YihY family inner membrane protein [Phycisphaerae bacterium]